MPQASYQILEWLMTPRAAPLSPYGRHGPSPGPRAFVLLAHASALAVAGRLLLEAPGDPRRRAALFFCGLVYFLRVCGTVLRLLKRRLAWPEALGIAGTLWLVQPWFAAAGGARALPLGPRDWAALALYLTGSGLNTGSELARDRWKKDPAHAGRLYTGGLFALSRHVNYFGDAVLFAGWALLTRSAWCLAVPAAMTAGFVFVNIPLLERHLKERYGSQFDAYAARTKSFVPFLF